MHAIVSIQLNIVTYPEKLIRDNFGVSSLYDFALSLKLGRCVAYSDVEKRDIS